LNHASIRRIANAGLLSLGVAALGACANESPAGPDGEKPSLGFLPAGGVQLTTNVLRAEGFKVCKTYSGAVGPSVTVTVDVDQLNDGDVDTSFPVTVANGECWLVWEAGGLVTDEITVTETVPGGYTASFVTQVMNADNSTTTKASVAGNAATETLINSGGQRGVLVTFTNTEIVATGCTLTQGYWKTHAEGKKDAWPVATLTIGGIVYTKAELVAIMKAPTAGNGLLSLVQQLIAAKLNVIEGADDSDIADEIADADAMIDAAGGKIALGPPSSPFIDPSTSSALNNALTAFNEGNAGVPHCGEGGI